MYLVVRDSGGCPHRVALRPPSHEGQGDVKQTGDAVKTTGGTLTIGTLGKDDDERERSRTSVRELRNWPGTEWQREKAEEAGSSCPVLLSPAGAC